MQVLAYVLFTLYNAIYLLATVFFLLFANTYLNGLAIPDSFTWKDGQLRDDLSLLAGAHATLLLLEGVVLAYLLFRLNKGFLSNVVRPDQGVRVATWTGAVHALTTSGAIIFLLYAGFK
ncbi:MAG: hypothetical protein ABI599_06605 [Flavobacteriales bacterium]